MNEMVARLERERREAERAHQEAEETLAAASQLHQDLRTEYDRWLTKKHDLVEQGKREANEKVAEIQAQAEEILQEIRDLQLEQGSDRTIKEHVLIDKKGAFDQLKQPEHLRKNKVLKREKAKNTFKVGDDVEVLTYGQRGTIIDQKSPKEFVVQMGILKMAIPAEELRPLDKVEPKRQVNVQRQAGSKVKTELDLRGQRYDAAMRQLSQYLDSALLSNHPLVTIIHGKGTGAIRQGVHKLLDQHPQVDHYEFAPPNAGGNGATLVYFK